MRYVFLCYDYQGKLIQVITSKSKLLEMYSEPKNKNRAFFNKLEIFEANSPRKIGTYFFDNLEYFFGHIIFTL